MEIHLKINDVVGMDDEKRHILRVDGEAMIAALMEHKGWLAQNVVRQLLLKHNTSLLNEILDDPVLRNNIYMAEKAKRDARGGVNVSDNISMRLRRNAAMSSFLHPRTIGRA